jgi:hypothetical protein
MHVVCAPGGLTLDGNAFAFYYGLGDFEPPAAPLGARPVGKNTGAILDEINPAARSLFVDATENDREWWGVGDIPAEGDVDVLAWPALTSCALPALSGMPIDAVLGTTGTGQVVVVGGTAPTSVARLDTGAVSAAEPDLRIPRNGESVTAFGSGALVAGGLDAQAPGEALADAEVYDPSLGGFDQQNPILLSEARANHGAAVLTTGETLLVGGVGADRTTVLASMEIVSPVTRTVRVQNVASLEYPRVGATVMRLATGNVLVAGGVDATGAPVTVMELFSSDVRTELATWQEPVAGAARAYAALPSGGVLFVVASPGVSAGPTAGASLQNTWLIDPDGTFEAATSVAGTLTHPVLFGGAAGAPAMWTGDRWLRWQPWLGSFGALGALDDVPAQVSDAVVSPDSGLAMWLDTSNATATVTALRFDTRGTYSTLEGPLLVDDTTNTSPDRLAVSPAIAFDTSHGLTLAPGATTIVTDRTYADVAVDLDLPTGATTLVVLRDESGRESVVGGDTCPLATPAGAASSIHVARTGASVQWSVSSGASGVCPDGVAPNARLSVGLRGAAGSAPSVARNLRVTRLDGP